MWLLIHAGLKLVLEEEMPMIAEFDDSVHNFNSTANPLEMLESLQSFAKQLPFNLWSFAFAYNNFETRAFKSITDRAVGRFCN